MLVLIYKILEKGMGFEPVPFCVIRRAAKQKQKMYHTQNKIQEVKKR
jgi:hypothetical protein